MTYSGIASRKNLTGAWIGKARNLRHLDTCATSARPCDGGQPFPMYKGPWGGKCILHSRDAAPRERASGKRLSVRERDMRTGKKHHCYEYHAWKAKDAENQTTFHSSRNNHTRWPRKAHGDPSSNSTHSQSPGPRWKYLVLLFVLTSVHSLCLLPLRSTMTTLSPTLGL